MARTIRTKVYKFDELNDKAKEVAINDLYDINIDGEWWESVYEDASNIGLKITQFDIDRGSYCKGTFTMGANEVAQNILNNHGEKCETYKTAESFMNNWQPVFCNYMDESHQDYESSECENSMMEMEDEFLKSLLEDYRIVLSKEYDYLTSKEAITETIQANEYEFTSDGRRF